MGWFGSGGGGGVVVKEGEDVRVLPRTCTSAPYSGCPTPRDRSRASAPLCAGFPKLPVRLSSGLTHLQVGTNKSHIVRHHTDTAAYSPVYTCTVVSYKQAVARSETQRPM